MMQQVLGVFFILVLAGCGAEKMDRQQVVNRHQVMLSEADTLTSLSLGNGRFAMTMDVTGLQTFPKHYKKGIPLGTMSEWGWHSFPSAHQYRIEETLDSLPSHGRKVPYAVHGSANSRAARAADYIRQNPHRIHLATVGWHLLKSDGSTFHISDITKIDQRLDLWNGELISKFEVEGVPVEVISVISQTHDLLGVTVKSELVRQNRLGVHIRYPYPTDHFLDEAANYDPDELSRLKWSEQDQSHFTIIRTLDTTRYYSAFASSLPVSAEVADHGYYIRPAQSQSSWSFSVQFSPTEMELLQNDFDALRDEVNNDFQTFWNTGGMIDFGETPDTRAAELERRMILSLYLTRINCAGTNPPQETGLTYNSWYGRPHMEMIWWHGVHFALWGRTEVLEKQLQWYLRNHPIARQMARRQGFEGVRWQKMTDNEGRETPSSIGSYLIWQQPHVVYFAELLYQIEKDEELLHRYHDVIEATAEFMSDFAWYETASDRYILGPGVIPAQERFDPEETFNPTYELAYWRWGLETAQKWKERLGLPRNPKWDEVLNKLSQLPVKDSLYLATENATDSYTKSVYMTDHPSVLGTYGMLPATTGMDEKIMANTFDKIWTDWSWEETWGWDFPMTAMTATRLNDPERAVDALLMPIQTNTYLDNGHNYQNERLRIYLPGNGGLLTALAMMAAGTHESPKDGPGFPAGWKVRHEGLHKMP